MTSTEDNSRRTAVAEDERVRSVAPQGSARLRMFYRLLPSISVYFRRRRMMKLISILDLKPGTRVLDLGGAPAIWEHVPVPLEITLLNLPGAVTAGEKEMLESPGLKHHTFLVKEGDACNAVEFADHSFDLVFSNSVIEHVGPPGKQAEFAREVARLGKAYWVQTPSKWFPIEAHSGMPYYWLYPEAMRRALMNNWRKRLPGWWADYISTTRVLSRQRMSELFPNGQTRVEYYLGFPKAYVSHSRDRGDHGLRTS